MHVNPVSLGLNCYIEHKAVQGPPDESKLSSTTDFLLCFEPEWFCACTSGLVVELALRIQLHSHEEGSTVLGRNI